MPVPRLLSANTGAPPALLPPLPRTLRLDAWLAATSPDAHADRRRADAALYDDLLSRYDVDDTATERGRAMCLADALSEYLPHPQVGLHAAQTHVRGGVTVTRGVAVPDGYRRTPLVGLTSGTHITDVPVGGLHRRHYVSHTGADGAWSSIFSRNDGRLDDDAVAAGGTPGFGARWMRRGSVPAAYFGTVLDEPGPWGGYRADDGYLTRVSAGVWRWRSADTINSVPCTPQTVCHRDLWGAGEGVRGVQAVVHIHGHDPGAAWLRTESAWAYVDMTFAESFADADTGDPLSPMDVLARSAGAWSSVVSVRHPYPVGEAGPYRYHATYPSYVEDAKAYGTEDHVEGVRFLTSDFGVTEGAYRAVPTAGTYESTYYTNPVTQPLLSLVTYADVLPALGLGLVAPPTWNESAGVFTFTVTAGHYAPSDAQVEALLPGSVAWTAYVPEGAQQAFTLGRGQALGVRVVDGDGAVLSADSYMAT